MVDSVIDGNSANERKSLIVVELVGLAGAGKTTLSRVLSQRDENVMIGAEIELRNPDHIPIFIVNFPVLLPIFIRGCQSNRWFAWDEIKSMVYLKAWPQILTHRTPSNRSVILLDHGPIFKLATLNEFGPEKLRSQGFQHWWKNMYKQWAVTLDMAIWLDAPHKILVERINHRDKQHAIKGKSDPESHRFLARYRTSYQQIFAKLAAHGDLQLLQFDTHHASIEQIADEILFACWTRLGES